jgi:hypothetical protein
VQVGVDEDEFVLVRVGVELLTTLAVGMGLDVREGEGAITRLILEEAEVVIFAIPKPASYPVAVKYHPSLDKVINPSPVAVPLANAKPTRAVKLNPADKCNLFFAKVLIWGFCLRS